MFGKVRIKEVSKRSSRLTMPLVRRRGSKRSQSFNDCFSWATAFPQVRFLIEGIPGTFKAQKIESKDLGSRTLRGEAVDCIKTRNTRACRP